jgi:hypothetical protein
VGVQRWWNEGNYVTVFTYELYHSRLVENADFNKIDAILMLKIFPLLNLVAGNCHLSVSKREKMLN